MSDKQLDDLKLHGIRNRQRYLNSTDWLLIRKYETTTAVSEEDLTKRQLARDEISLIRDATTFEEVNSIDIDF